MTVRTLRFGVLPGVTLEIRGDDATLRHYEAEYGAGSALRAGDDPANVRVTIGRGPRDDGASVLAGSHKTVSWHAAVSPPDADPISATIGIRGVPRWFGLSLTQGYLVEPLLSVAAAAVGRVLLPAAGIVTKAGAIVLLGRSRSGKSSLTARAAAAGLAVLGDDQVLVAASGRVTRFPRRLRVYDDMHRTAPDAYRRLPARARRALRVRRLARIATLGYVRPSLAVPASAIGASEAEEGPLTRFVVLERNANASRIEVQQLDLEAALAAAAGVLDDQRRHLVGLGAAWSERLSELATSERSVLADAISRVSAERFLVPDEWTAEASVSALWDRLRA